MKMIDYNEIWSSINKESQSSSIKTQIARRVQSKSIFPVFLATDFKKKIRLLYVKLDSDYDIIDNLPRFKGLEISISNASIGDIKNGTFLKFTQSIPNTDKIFESVISDICDKVIQLEHKKNLVPALMKVVNEWKLFFEKQEKDILSIEAQKGLVGELYFLRDYLFRKYAFTESLFFWTGSERTNHDFQLLNNAIEIKTTSSKQHKKFTISSERQLDNTGLDHLYLAVFEINLHNNVPERTLPSLIHDIYNIIQDDSISTFQFQIKLAKYGYNDALADKYNVGFSLSDMKFYEVVDGFPRLLQRDLPDGIGDINYSVILAACTPFEITSDILKYI